MKNIHNSLVSVIMPAYNAEKHIMQSVNSVLNQTYQNYELIIVDDCSKDNTFKLIKKLEEKYDNIRAYKNEKNMGVAETRNFGISKSSGEWIAFLDSDDIWKETKLEKQMNVTTKQPEVEFMFTGSSFIDEEGNPYSYTLSVPTFITYNELLKQNLISCSSVLIKKEIIQNIKFLDVDFHEDYYAWLLVLKEKKAYGIDEPLLIYRIARNSKSGNKVKSAIMNYRVYRKAGLNFIQSMYYMFIYGVNGLKKYWSIFKQ